MTTRLSAAAIVLAVGLVACSGGSGSDKAGGSDPGVTLKMGTEDGPGGLGGDTVEEFARHVEELSDGAIQIEPVYSAHGNAAHQHDQVIARRIESGGLEMGMVAARAWDTEGVDSLRALHAPLLVTSEAIVDQIVSGEMGDDMLSGLEDAGVIGLALLPEPSGLRHPFGFDGALLSPKDFIGKGIRAPRSDVVYATLRELGADPKDLNLAEFRIATADGSVQGAEASFDLAIDFPASSVAAGNVTLYARTNSVVVNKSVFDGLSSDRQDILRAAAERTREWAAGNVIPDAEAAKIFCERGGTVKLASSEDLGALEEAVRPVYAELEEDPVTRRLIAEIRALKEEIPEGGPRVEACNSS